MLSKNYKKELQEDKITNLFINHNVAVKVHFNPKDKVVMQGLTYLFEELP